MAKSLSKTPDLDIKTQHEVSAKDDAILRAARDKSTALRTVLSAWKVQQVEERKLRAAYAGRLLWALFVQVGLVNIAFFAIGFGWLEIDEWTARTFIMAVFAEIAGLVLCVVKYLFSKNGNEIFELVKKL